MSQPDNWRKASFSFSNGNCVEVANDFRKSSFSKSGNCVEAAGDSGVILVRDTADRDGPVVRFPAEAWRAFLGCVRADA